MSKQARIALGRIETLVRMGCMISISEGMNTTYEVTVYPPHGKSHAHYGGATVADAMSHAWDEEASTFAPPLAPEEGRGDE